MTCLFRMSAVSEVLFGLSVLSEQCQYAGAASVLLNHFCRKARREIKEMELLQMTCDVSVIYFDNFLLVRHTGLTISLFLLLWF